MRSPCPSSKRSLDRSLIGLLLTLAMYSSASAQPSGGAVVDGSATIAALPGGVNVTQQSDRAVINWQSFSVDAGQFANFNLPNASSAVLNRVTTPGLPSEIFGSINSNGHVFLINPAGIMVGPTGVINTQGFTASTLDLPNSQFMQGGELHFQGTAPGSVINKGTIFTGAGGATLIGGSVVNEGTIVSEGGSVTLIAGNDVKLTAAGTYIQADMQTLMNGVSEYAGVINNAGTIRATGAAKIGGEVYLVNPNGKVLQQGLIAAQKQNEAGQLAGGAVKINAAEAEIGGVIQASGVTGGSVEITGDEVILAGATIDASGDTAGGSVRIGGGLQGNDSNVKNANNTSVDAASKIAVDARQAGNAGSVVIWSNNKTDFAGQINARALGISGNGGFAEVSGKQTLGFSGRVDLRGGVLGHNGTLLLDPTDFVIGAAEAAAIVTALGTSHVVVSTSPAGVGNGDVLINSDVVYSSGNSFTVLAHRHIFATAAVQNDGTGDVNLVAGWNGVTGAPGGSGVQNVGAAFDMAAIFSSLVSYGQGGGSLFVSNGAAVGSRNGVTNVAAWDVNIGSDSDFAQIGYFLAFNDPNTVASVLGNIRVDARNIVSMLGDGHSQIGHTINGSVLTDVDVILSTQISGNIAVNAQNILLGPSSNSGIAQIGHALELFVLAGNLADDGTAGTHGTAGTAGGAGGTGAVGGPGNAAVAATIGGDGEDATLNVSIAADISGAITVVARNDVTLNGSGVSQIGHSATTVVLAAASGGDGGAGGNGAAGGSGGSGGAGSTGSAAVGNGTNGANGTTPPPGQFTAPGNGTNAPAGGSGGPGGNGGAGAAGGNGFAGGRGGDATVNVLAQISVAGDVSVTAGNDLFLAPQDSSVAQIGNTSLVGVFAGAFAGNGGAGGSGGVGGTGGGGGAGGNGGTAIGNGGNGGNAVTQNGSNRNGTDGGDAGDAAVGGAGGNGGNGGAGGAGGNAAVGGSGGNATVNLSVAVTVDGATHVQSGANMNLTANDIAIAHIGNASLIAGVALTVSGDGGNGGTAGSGGVGGSGAVGGSGGSGTGNGGSGGNGSNATGPQARNGGAGGDAGDAARGGNGGNGGNAGSGAAAGVAANGGDSGNTDITVDLGGVVSGNITTVVGNDLTMINGHIGPFAFNLPITLGFVGDAGIGGGGAEGGAGGSSGAAGTGGVAIGVAGTAGTRGTGAAGGSLGALGASGLAAANGANGSIGAGATAGGSSVAGTDGGTGTFTENPFQSFTSLEGNVFVGVGQGATKVGRLIADANSSFTTGVEYELRFYMPDRDSYQVLGASLNGFAAPAPGTNPLPNEQGEFPFGTGPYVITTPQTNFAFYFNPPTPVPPVPPVPPTPPFVPTGFPLGSFVYDQFTRYELYWQSIGMLPSGGMQYLGNINYGVGPGPATGNLGGMSSFNVFGGTQPAGGGEE